MVQTPYRPLLKLNVYQLSCKISPPILLLLPISDFNGNWRNTSLTPTDAVTTTTAYVWKSHSSCWSGRKIARGEP